MAEWTTPSSVHSKCGETGSFLASRAIDDNIATEWRHSETCYHWIIFDMGETKKITKIRLYGKAGSARWGSTTGLYVYVSDDVENWGEPVWEGALLTDDSWEETDAFDKNGRYVKLVSKVNSEWQRMYEFDAYAETVGGQLYEINVDAVVKAIVEKAFQTTYNIEKDATVRGSAVHGEESTFNIPKDAIAKALTSLSFELGIPVEALVKASALTNLESTLNINKDVVAKASAIVSPETIFNVIKYAIVEASASPQIVAVIPITKDAVVKASATPSPQQTLGISKDAVAVAVSAHVIQSAFNISPEAIVKVLAEVDVIKEKPEVVRLFIVLGLQHSALVLGLSHATIDLSVETPHAIELEVN